MHTFLRSTRCALVVIANAVVASTLPQTVFADDSNTTYGVGAGSGSGVFNSAFGYDALNSNASGNFNTANGAYALYSNSAGSGNTAVGAGALRDNTQGNQNTAMGVTALNINTVGSYNTAIGYNALVYSTGNSNIALGDGAGEGITTGSNNIHIGHGGNSTDDNYIRIGSGQTTTMIAGIWNTSISGGVQVYINKYGHLGAMSSSQRFKEDIQTIEAVSDKLLQLRPVSFRYKQAADDGSKPLQYGLIAEEVAKVYPELVEYDADGKPFTVYYNLLTPLMLNELQKEHAASSTRQEKLVIQQAEIAMLNQELTTHRAEILAMQQQQDAAMTALQQKLNQLEEVLQESRADGVTAAKVTLMTNR